MNKAIPAITRESFYSLHSYSTDPEWSMWPVDAVFHTGTRRASRQRLARRLAVRFAGVEKTKLAAIQAVTTSALIHRWGLRAWSIHIQAFGETLFVIRNTAYTLQDPKDRRVCVLHLENALLHRRRLEAQELGWVEGVVLGVTFLLGAFLAWQIHPFIRPPTLASACHYTVQGLRGMALEILP